MQYISWRTKDHLEEEGGERLARRNRRSGVFHGRGAFSRAQSRDDRFENNARRRRWSSSFLSLEGPRHLSGMPPRQGPPFPPEPESERERERAQRRKEEKGGNGHTSLEHRRGERKSMVPVKVPEVLQTGEEVDDACLRYSALNLNNRLNHLPLFGF